MPDPGFSFSFGDCHASQRLHHTYENLDSAELRRVLIEPVSTPDSRRVPLGSSQATGEEGVSRFSRIPKFEEPCAAVQRGSVHDETAHQLVKHQNEPELLGSAVAASGQLPRH